MARVKSVKSFFKNPVLVRVLIGLLLLLLLFSVFLYLVPVILINPLLERTQAVQYTFEPSDFGVSAKHFTAMTTDNISISGYEIECEAPKGIVVMIPGMDNPPSSSFFGHAKLFYDYGYASVIYDPRAKGDSEGNTMGLGISECSDVDAIITYIRTKSVYVDVPIILFGVSVGGTTAINAAATNQHADAVIAVSAIPDIHGKLMNILENDMNVPSWIMSMEDPFVSLYMMVTFGMDSLDKMPLKTIKSLGGRSVFLMHSRYDPENPVDNTLALYEIAGTDAELWIREAKLPLISEYFLNPSYDEEYADKLIGFVDSIPRSNKKEGA